MPSHSALPKIAQKRSIVRPVRPIQPKIEVKTELDLPTPPEKILKRVTIPGSLRMRPEAGRKQMLRPDWAAPCTGITVKTDHRKKFKINQMKTMKLVKNGKGNFYSSYLIS